MGLGPGDGDGVFRLLEQGRGFSTRQVVDSQVGSNFEGR